MPINFSTSRAIFPWRPACWLRVSGEDAATFLQGQFTNDLRTLAAGGAVYGLWLTVKGKVVADSFVLPGGAPNAFWVGSYFSPADRVRERLEHHVIADDVVVEDETARWAGLSLWPDDGASWPQPAPAGMVGFPGRRDRVPTLEWMYPVDAGEPGWVSDLRATGRLIEPQEVERRRITAGIPAVPMDIGPGDLPNEGGLETTAISYQKGCYLGQEVMARLKSMGQVRRRLLRVRGTGAEPPARPAPVFLGARPVGELRSAVSDGAGGWIGLALLTLLHVPAGAALALAADAPPTLHRDDAS
ncbi:MAG: folate-binding protein [Opitutaceae bacterium]|nr:folate-binding protein [Opitutaceae bacterium]